MLKCKVVRILNLRTQNLVSVLKVIFRIRPAQKDAMYQLLD